MLNSIVIMGRLTRDPDLRMTQNQKSVVNFTLAVDRDYAATGERKETDFIDVVAFGATADHIHKFYTKGMMAIVTGRLQLRDWTDREGIKRRSYEVIADQLYISESTLKYRLNKLYAAVRAKGKKEFVRFVRSQLESATPFEEYLK